MPPGLIAAPLPPPRSRSPATRCCASCATDRLALLGLVLVVGLSCRRARARGWRPTRTRDGVRRTSASASLAPSGAHWFGTDQLGRDMLSRVLMGARPALLISSPSCSARP